MCYIYRLYIQVIYTCNINGFLGILGSGWLGLARVGSGWLRLTRVGWLRVGVASGWAGSWFAGSGLLWLRIGLAPNWLVRVGLSRVGLPRVKLALVWLAQVGLARIWLAQVIYGLLELVYCILLDSISLSALLNVFPN